MRKLLAIALLCCAPSIALAQYLNNGAGATQTGGRDATGQSHTYNTDAQGNLLVQTPNGTPLPVSTTITGVIAVSIVDGGGAGGGGGGGPATQSGNWAVNAIIDGGVTVNGTVAVSNFPASTSVQAVSIVDGGVTFPTVQAVSIVDGGVGLSATTFTVFAAATTAGVTHTSSTITGMGSYGSMTIEVNWAAITGAPLTCTLQIQTDANSTLTNWGPSIPLAPSGSTTQLVYPSAWPGPLGPNVAFVYSCGTFPTGGTMTVTAAMSSQDRSSFAITDNANGLVAVKAASTAAAATDTSLVVQLNPNNAANTTAYIVQGASATNTSVSRPIEAASRSTADAAAPASVTVGNQGQAIGDTYGRLMVQTFHPNHWSCNLSSIAAQTQCQAAPGAGLSLYLTDVILDASVASNTNIVIGTGANCGTGTTVVQGGDSLAINGTLTIAFNTPIKATANNALCCQPSASTTCTFNGFTAP